VDGLTVYGGLSEVEQFVNSGTHSGDKSEDVLGIKYTAGGFSVGYQQTSEDTGLTGTASYENTSYGITFNVNDDLSIGYNHTDSDKSGSSYDAEADSLQVAYTMGGASIRLMEQSVKDQSQLLLRYHKFDP
jgi:outer membrane protein OmpU